ncbi:MAG: glycoside hydrolase family 38 C-terminal domain-containing protein, partial [Prevotellaceae bacterium]|nr:glycoside hydrolase family 38 C-terminal domain-containing protein [Prevotellaceae bacterium]
KKDADIKIINATSDQLYKDFLPFDAHKELPYFKGELTMDLHGNGCYTSEAAMKLYNRQNEHLGDAAERAAVIADWAGANAYPYNQLLDTWRKVIWHQFHDDLTGTSIPRAYEFSWNDELIALKSFSDVLTTSASAFASKLDTRVSGQPIVVYNAEAFDAVSVAQVDVPTADKSYIIKDSKGNTVPSQVVTDTKGKSHLLFEAKVPATGYAVFGMKEAGKAKALKVIEPKKIENECYAMTINDNGDITSLIDKKSNRQLVAEGKALRLVVFDKCESYDWPAWEIPKAIIDRAPVGIDGNVEVTKIEDGALRTTVKISKTYGESVINQFVTLWHGSLSNRIDFYNEVEWKSLNALLKAEFPLAAANEKASYDLGLGTIQRGNNCDNAFEVYSHEWTDLTDKSGKYGVTILNNCRYGWDKPNDNTLRLSLLYSPKPARSYTYQARQDIGYHEFTYSIISHEGDLNLADAAKQSAVLNSPLKAFTTTAHAGEMGKEFSFVSSDNENVIVRCVKRAENGNEYIIRVYELAGKTVQKANITFASDITKAEIADGTEKVIGEASFSGKTLQAEVRPFSVMTYRITLGKKAEASSTNGITIDLPYDKITASVNGFRSAANFADGYSYAAELLPEDNTLTSAGITFKLGDRLSRNGLVCKGNSFDIPEGCNKVYLLAASDDVDRKVTFTVGKTKQERNIPCYTGFIGQWGHDGHTIGFVKDADVAYIGSHRHSANGDEPYEYTYMFRIALDIPKGAKQVILPDNEHIVLFAATGVNETVTAKPASKFFTSSNLDDEGS